MYLQIKVILTTWSSKMRMIARTILLSHFIAGAKIDPLPAGLHSNLLTQIKKPF